MKYLISFFGVFSLLSFFASFIRKKYNADSFISEHFLSDDASFGIAHDTSNRGYITNYILSREKKDIFLVHSTGKKCCLCDDEDLNKAEISLEDIKFNHSKVSVDSSVIHTFKEVI